MERIAVFIVALYLAAVGAEKERTDYGVFLRLRTKQLFDLCGGEAPATCTCSHAPGVAVDGPFDANADLLGAGLVYGGCNPDYCKCRGSGEEKDVQMEEMRKVMGTCPRNKMSRCLCHNNEVAKFPFNLEVFYFECRPKKCKCENDRRAKPVTGFGCAKGGFPFCTQWDFQCTDGTQISQNVAFEFLLSGSKECICSDGLKPFCKSTGRPPRCPDGSKIKPSLGSPGQYYDACKDRDKIDGKA